MKNNIKDRKVHINWVVKALVHTKKIKEIDKSLLKIIIENSRLSLKAVGKKLKISKVAVFHKIKKLENLQIITGYSTFIDFTKLGLKIYNVGIKTSMTLQEKYEYVEQTEKLLFINQILLLSGSKWDFLIRIICKEENINNNINLLQRDKVQLIEVIQTNTGLFFSQQKKEVIPLITPSAIEPFSKRDILVLRRLAENSKEKIIDLAQAFDCDPKTILTTITNLKKKNILRMCITTTNPFIYGGELYLLMITTKSRSAQLPIAHALARTNSSGNLLNIQEPDIISFHIVESFKDLKNVENVIKPFLNKIRHYEFVRVEEQTQYNLFPDEAYHLLLESST